MEQESICGLAYEVECHEIEIQEIVPLDFLLWFIDGFAQTVEKSRKPLIKVSLFEHTANLPIQVVITPVDIDDVSFVQTRRTFQIILSLYTSETVTAKSFPELLAVVKVCINAIRIISLRKGLTYKPKLSIINSNEARIGLTFGKTI